MITVQAPQYRQYALISDFLDLAHLRRQEEAALATKWIKGPPEGMKLENLALATMAGPVLSSLPQNMTADVQYAIEKNASLWAQGNNRSFTQSNRHLQEKFPRIRQSSDVICCRICISSAVCCFRASLVEMLTSLRAAVNQLLGCSSGNPVQDQLA